MKRENVVVSQHQIIFCK